MSVTLAPRARMAVKAAWPGVSMKVMGAPPGAAPFSMSPRARAKLAARNQRVSVEKRDEKEEMVTWMRTWLENPDVFALWVAMRVRAWNGG